MRRIALAWLVFLAAGCPKPAPVVSPVTAGDAPAFSGLDAYLDRPLLEKAVAHVRVEPSKRLMTGSATLTIRTDGVAEFPIVFDAWVAGHGGLNLSRVSQDGAPCATSIFGEDQKVLIVRVPNPGKRITLTMEWSGSPTPSQGNGYLLADEGLLLDIQGWLPFLPATDADWTLDLEWPKSFDAIVENGSAPKTIAGGFLSTHSTFHSHAGSTIFLAPSFTSKKFTLDGNRILIALPSGAKDDLPRLEETVRAAWEGLKPIGKLPDCELRIVSATMTMQLLAALGGRSFVAFRGTVPDVPLLAHEMAHSWWGGSLFAAEVRDDVLGRKAARTELWPESFAEYSSSWANDDAGLARTRAGWLMSYEGGLGEGVYMGRTAASYTRAPLLLSGIEHRAGRAKMRKALTELRRRYEGKRIGWPEIFGVLRDSVGDAETKDLEAWINHPGAPDLRLVDTHVTDGVLTGTLQQTSDPPYPGTIELAFYAETMETAEVEKNRLSTVPVRFDGKTTPVSVKVPPGAKTVFIDPDVYLPRTISMEDAKQQGVLLVPLDRKGAESGSGWFLTPPP